MPHTRCVPQFATAHALSLHHDLDDTIMMPISAILLSGIFGFVLDSFDMLAAFRQPRRRAAWP